MADDTNEHVVLAIFADETTAARTVGVLKTWDRANADIKLGAIATIAKDGDKVVTHVGHKTGRGARVGTIVGVIAAILTGGLTLLGGVVGGAALGSIVGRFMKQSLQLTEEEIQALGAELDAGKGAVVVLCDEDEIKPLTAKLASIGGQVRTYDVPAEAVTETSAALAVESAPTGTSSPTDA